MKKINTRIIALLGLLVFLICSGLGLVAYINSYNSLKNVLKETMPKVAQEGAITIEDGIQNQLNKLHTIASLDYMKVLNTPDGDYSSITTIMKQEVKRSEHKQMILIDKNGNALYDNGTTSVMNDNPFYIKALSGEDVVSDPMLDSDEKNIIMYYAVPIKIEGEIAGVLMAIRDGMELSQFAGRIKFGETGEAFIINHQGKTIAHADQKLLKEIVDTHTADATSSVSVDATSSATVDAVSSSTIVKSGDNIEGNNEKQSVNEENDESSLGFRGFSNVQKKMMEGEAGFEEYEYKGISKVAGIAPIEKYGWSIAVAVDKEEMMYGLSYMKQTFFLTSMLFLLTGLIIAYFIGRSISKPITYLANQCNAISDGDFSKTMDPKYTKRQDEIGHLAKGFNKINTNVSRIIKNVVSETSNVSKAIENINENMRKLSSEMNGMSINIQNLSSKMEETSAMAQEMNATSMEIEGAIDSIANKAQEGAQSAGEVSYRAEKLKNSATDSQRKAQQIQEDVAVKLREAIEKSKAVEEIKMLSDVILGIAAQTNLLALNASIEAAQAGNEGRGFGVVAEEIRKLAQHSKETVNEIREVTEKVVESVQALSISSGQVLEFLENKVVKDYDMLVETGEQYNNDAQFIDQMVTDLSATTEELYASIQNMANAINDVAAASDEGSGETSDLVNRANNVANNTKNVLEKTFAVNDSSKKLMELVSSFKVQ